MDRREFMAAGLAAAASTMAPLACSGAAVSPAADPAGGRFRLGYAPHFGMFRQRGGEDLVDQIRFMADEGFAAVEDHGLTAKPTSLVERIGKELLRRDMTMGLFVATANYGEPTFASGRPDLRDWVLHDMRQAVDTAQRVGGRWCAVVPGKLDSRLPIQKQTVNAIDLLKRCVDIVEPAGLTLLIEPLQHGTRQPRLFLHSLEQSRMICRAVDSPCCRILFDAYHMQVAGRDPVQSLLSAWNEVGYVQVGDYPGRKEPGTGTIDFRHLFSLLEARGYEGMVGMEHGNSLPGEDGENRVIAAYADHDPRPLQG